MRLWQICQWSLAIALGAKPVAIGTIESLCKPTQTIIMGNDVHFGNAQLLCLHVLQHLPRLPLLLPLGQWALALGLWLWGIGPSPSGMCPLAFVLWHLDLGSWEIRPWPLALAHVDIGVWPLALGPWAMGMGRWALGLGPWALGLGP